MDLFRKVLLEIEQVPPGQWRRINVEGATSEEVRYHAKLADDAGFVEARFLGNDPAEFVAHRLTYLGHEFLDAARNDNLWLAAKKRMMDSVGVLTIDGLKLVLQELVKAALHRT